MEREAYVQPVIALEGGNVLEGASDFGPLPVGHVLDERGRRGVILFFWGGEGADPVRHRGNRLVVFERIRRGFPFVLDVIAVSPFCRLCTDVAVPLDVDAALVRLELRWAVKALGIRK